MERRYFIALVALALVLAVATFTACHRLVAYDSHLAAVARV